MILICRPASKEKIWVSEEEDEDSVSKMMEVLHVVGFETPNDQRPIKGHLVTYCTFI